ncbi:SsrA-binding protein [uncultured Dokdonia sp.]|nr:SsrA-binding protein [uncultured Dokdonia sp.]
MQTLYKFLAKVNKAVLPSYSKRGLDLTQASKIQLAIFGYRIWVTKRALD